MEEILNKNARAALEVLRASQRHPTALDVFEAVRKTLPRYQRVGIWQWMFAL